MLGLHRCKPYCSVIVQDNYILRGNSYAEVQQWLVPMTLPFMASEITRTQVRSPLLQQQSKQPPILRARSTVMSKKTPSEAALDLPTLESEGREPQSAPSIADMPRGASQSIGEQDMKLS